MQILNVYYPKYEMGGKLWPIMHNTIVFSLVLMQVIALGVFTIKHSPVATGFTILLLVATVLFNEYCRHRFSRIFEAYSAQVIEQRTPAPDLSIYLSIIRLRRHGRRPSLNDPVSRGRT